MDCSFHALLGFGTLDGSGLAGQLGLRRYGNVGVRFAGLCGSVGGSGLVRKFGLLRRPGGNVGGGLGAKRRSGSVLVRGIAALRRHGAGNIEGRSLSGSGGTKKFRIPGSCGGWQTVKRLAILRLRGRFSSRRRQFQSGFALV
jgi:hypothetical protein